LLENENLAKSTWQEEKMKEVNMNEKKKFGGTTPMFFHTLWITFEVHLLTVGKLWLG
jgi:hypothetical protein